MNDDIENLDRLADELEGLRVDTPAPGLSRLEPWLRMVADRGASDLLLVAGEPPTLRVNGRIVAHRCRAARRRGHRRDGPARAAAARAARSIATRASPTPRARCRASAGSASTCIASAGAPRPRSACCRAKVPLAREPRSAARHGGARAHAARARHRRRRHRLGQDDDAGGARRRHQPARSEAHHHDRRSDRIRARRTSKSVIQQVEIGVDAPDFPTALRSALRQAPDVIVVGEMRDPETMRIALAAGETGHLVLSTLHTTDVPSTVARMTDSFPAERQPTIRQEIAAALVGGVRADAAAAAGRRPRAGGGTAGACSYGARQHIRRNALQHLHQEITITRRHGSFTLEECLAHLVKRGLVDRAEAALRANHPDEFESRARIGLMAQEPSRRAVDSARPLAARAWDSWFVAEFAVLEAALRVHGGIGGDAGRSSRCSPTTEQVGHRLRPNAQRALHDVGVHHRHRDQRAGRARRRADRPEAAGRAAHRRARRFAGAVRAGAARRDVLQAARGAAERARAAADRWRVINAGVQGYGRSRSGCSSSTSAPRFSRTSCSIVAFVGNDAIEAFDREPRLDARPSARASRRRPTRARSCGARAREHGAAVRAHALGSAAQPGSRRTWRARAAAGRATLPIRRRRSTHGLDVSATRVRPDRRARARPTARGPAIVLMPARFRSTTPTTAGWREIVRAAGGELVRNSATERFATALAPLGCR